MSKKRILFVYPNMKVGGSTTALLSLLNCLDYNKYEVDLQLLKNEGPLMPYIPQSVNLLPEAINKVGKSSKPVKLAPFLFKGYALKAIVKMIFSGNKKWLETYFAECVAKEYSSLSKKSYDYAVGGLEGWSNRYVAYNVKADHKYGWIHSTFSKTTNNPQGEKLWIRKLEKLVFVSPNCKSEFQRIMPEFSDKAVFLENITDSDLIKQRSLELNSCDELYNCFVDFKGLKLITVCRLQMQTKGLDRMVSCAKKLKAEGVEFLWYLLGDGEDKEALLKLINEAELSDKIVMTGEIINPFPYIKTADVTCLLSRYEGKPMIVTESMILGTPALVTEYLSAHNQIEHCTNGYIVANDDSVADEFYDFIMNSELLKKIKNELIYTEYGNKNYISVVEKELFLS